MILSLLSPLIDFSCATINQPIARVESTPPIKRRSLDRGIIVARAVNIVTNQPDIVLTSPYKKLFARKQIYVPETGTSDKEEGKLPNDKMQKEGAESHPP